MLGIGVFPSINGHINSDKMEEKEDEEPGGLSLLVPRPEKAEARYTDEINVEMVDDVTQSEYTPFYVTLNDDSEEEKDTEPGGLSSLVLRPDEVETLKIGGSNVETSYTDEVNVEMIEDVTPSEYVTLNDGGLSSLVLRPCPGEVVASYTDEVEVETLKNGGSNATQIQLMNKDVTELPESPDCPNLTSLSLQRNSDLTSIPASFFELMPNLKEVDLSDTGVKSLPGSFFDLVTLEKLFLRNCQAVMELPAKIGQLHNLEVLDLEGTEIIQLPAEIGDLVNLTCLRVSLCQCAHDLDLVPEGALSKLAQLIELCIDVDPEDSRWEGAVRVVIKELGHLKKLRDLKMYLPQVELLDELTRNLPFLLGSSMTGYNLNVGRHMRRVMSPTPLGAEGKSEHTKKQLRYVNGKGSIPSQVKNLLKYSESLFLDRHFTVGKLSEFGMENLGNLRYCKLGECNELKTIVEDWDGHDPVLPKLRQLIIYNMKTLTSISNAPLKDNSLRLLKILKLHGCAQLRTIFVIESGISLVHLEEITVEDCPAVLSLITCNNSHGQIGWSFSRLKKISLLYLTRLQSIFSGRCTAPHLERLSVYDCPNLRTLSAKEISRADRLKVINGEAEWWKALEWNESEDWLQKLASVFVPIRSDADLETQLADLEIQLAQDPTPDQSDIDVERVLEKQDTHDLYCPNCKSCITKRVILRRRKREQRMAQHDEGQASGTGFDKEGVDLDVEGVIEKQETHDLVCPNCHSCITRRVIVRTSQRKPKWPELAEHDVEVLGCFQCLLFFRCFGTV